MKIDWNNQFQRQKIKKSKILCRIRYLPLSVPFMFDKNKEICCKVVLSSNAGESKSDKTIRVDVQWNILRT